MYRTITEILDIARTEQWDVNRLKAEISYYLRENDLTKRDAEQVKEQYAKAFEFIQGSTIIDTEGFSRAINEFGSQFAKSKTGVNEKIMAAVNKHWVDLDHTTLRKEIAHQMGALRHYSETIRRTAVTGMQSAVSVEKAVKNGIKKFKYIGPPAERGFCKLHLGKTYTIEEIKQMSNGMGLDVFTYRGGWNCRHKWVPVKSDKVSENLVEKSEEVSDEFVPAKTIQEAEEWAKGNLKTTIISFKGVNVNTANQVNRSLFNIENQIKEFPETSIKFGGVKTRGAYAEYDPETNIVSLKNNFQNLEKRLEDDDQRWRELYGADFHVDATVMGNITHELMHSYDNNTGRVLYKSLEKLPLEIKNKLYGISGYASKDRYYTDKLKGMEMMAEVLTAKILKKSKYYKLPQEAKDIIEKHLK